MMTASIVEIAVKSSLVIALAAVAAGLMRRRGSAASRHLVWTLATFALLVLPIASAVLPGWGIPIYRQEPAAPPPALPLAPQATDGVTVPTAASVAQSPTPIASISWIALLPMAYMAGVMLLLGRLAVEHWKTRRMLSRTTRLDDAAWNGLLDQCTASLGIARAVRLVRSREEAMPMTCGVRRPVVVLPSIADLWDEDRRRAVLLHELAHVVRFDCLTQTLAEVAVALYWAHPGTWWMARRLRVERELACDDCVLSSGTEPREYAGHLLEIAHSLGGYRAPALAVGMARPQQLEGRMLALLDATRNRATPATSRRLFALVLTAVVVTPLAAATLVSVPVAQDASSAPAARTASAAAAAAGAMGQSRSAPAMLAGGTWQIRLNSDSRTAQLTIGIAPNSSYGTTIPVDRVEGLAAILAGPGGPAHYTLKRDAGTFDFEGVIRSGAGGGTFSFTPSATFGDELVRRGFSKPTPLELGTLAWSDIGFAFLDELNALKYERPTLQQLVQAAQHGVTRTYVRDMADLGYRLGMIDALVVLRNHGVDPAFVRGMAEQGMKGLSADELVRARNHGVDAQYIQGLRAIGYQFNMDQLVDARNHGIDPAYVLGLQSLGFKGLTLEDLVNARNHGVDPGFVRAMAAAGYEHLSIGDLIKLRSHGVDAKTVQRLKARGIDHPSIDRLIELQNRGASADPALVGPQLHASKNLMASLHTVVRDADAAVQRWVDRWLK